MAPSCQLARGGMRRWIVVWLTATLGGACGGSAHAGPSGKGLARWGFYASTRRHAKYIGLTPAIAPGGPLWPGVGGFPVGPTAAALCIPGGIEKGEGFSYE